MKLYTMNIITPYATIPRVTAKLTGQQLEVVKVTPEFKKSEQFAKLSSTDSFPLLETKEGGLNETSAMAIYICQLAGGKYLGSNPVQRSLVDQWISFSNQKLAPLNFQHSGSVLSATFGWFETHANEYNEGLKNLKADVKTINTALEGKKYLCGDEMTIADLIVATNLMLSLQTVLDSGFRKAMKNIEPWAKSIYDLPEFIDVQGKIRLCDKALKPVGLIEEKKEEKKKEAPKEAAPKQEEKPAKVLDNVESLPPSSFDLFTFKTLFVNHPDKKGEGMDEWYKQMDWEGWSFWRLEYDIYEGEGAKEHITKNLLGGFINRAEHTSKYTFGRMCVLGDEPNLQIRGVWMMRGQQIPDGLAKEHAQFEYYKTRKLDPRNSKEDDQLIRDYMGGKVGDKIEGLECRVI